MVLNANINHCTQTHSFIKDINTPTKKAQQIFCYAFCIEIREVYYNKA